MLSRIDGGSFLFNTRVNVDGIFNQPRLDIIILQVSIIGIIALGVTQVIIPGGIDLRSGSVVGATAMIAMSFAQTATVNGNPNPKAIFGDWAMDLPVIVPILVGLGCGMLAGLINGLLIAYTRIPPFIATLGMMVSARGVARLVVERAARLVPDRQLCPPGEWRHPRHPDLRAPALAGREPRGHLHRARDPVPPYPEIHASTASTPTPSAPTRRRRGCRGSRSTGHKVLVYMIAGCLRRVAAIMLTSKNLTAQAGMGVMYELDAIAMAVIGGVSLSGGRGSIVGTVLGAADLLGHHLRFHLRSGSTPTIRRW